MFNKEFDDSSQKDILRHAKQMVGKCLRDVLCENDSRLIMEDINSYGKKRKGHLGNLIEEFVFGISPNSFKKADFIKAKVELKTIPLKSDKKRKYKAKERLVFSMIDYMTIINEKWETSSFIEKNRMLLLMFYLFQSGISLLDYKFKIVELLDLLKDLPQADIEIIKQDWEIIVSKIRQGKAHELSEGNTNYLAACTKGTTSEKSYRRQPCSKIKAKSRALSLKTTYLNKLIENFLGLTDYDSESYLKDIPIVEVRKSGIENITLKKFEPFLSLSIDEIASKVEYDLSKKHAKNYLEILARAMLGVKKRKVEEFEKAGIILKTIKLEHTGRLKESMSFPIIDYMDIVKETWEESTFRDYLSSHKFLFVIFQKCRNGVIYLKKVKFWEIPYNDLENHVKKVWIETQKRIRQGKEELPKMSEDPVCHVRPHARNKKDRLITPTGTMIGKKSFWLNSKYIQNQIES